MLLVGVVGAAIFEAFVSFEDGDNCNGVAVVETESNVSLFDGEFTSGVFDVTETDSPIDF